VLNRLCGSHTDETALEVGWIVRLGHDDTVIAAPIIEHLALAPVLDFPMIDQVAHWHA